jgi:hypothetical protein
VAAPNAFRLQTVQEPDQWPDFSALDPSSVAAPTARIHLQRHIFPFAFASRASIPSCYRKKLGELDMGAIENEFYQIGQRGC